jgi:hypothetical protein
MGFLFRIFKSAFVRHLVSEGLEVVEKEALERLQANQKRKRAPNKPKEGTNTEVKENG